MIKMSKRKIIILFGIFIFCGILSLAGFKVNAAANDDYYVVDNETLQKYAFNNIQVSMQRLYGDIFIDEYGVQYVERNVFTLNFSLDISKFL